MEHTQSNNSTPLHFPAKTNIITTRRAFLCKTSLLAAAATLVPTTVPAALLVRPGYRTLNEISLAAFKARLHTQFLATHSDGLKLPLTLVKVESRPPSAADSPKAPDKNHEKFRLVFHGPLETRLEQGEYRLEHPTLGKFDLFIVPGPSRLTQRVCYEAVFNRAPIGARSNSVNA